MEEFLRANVEFSIEERFFVDVQNIFHQMEQRTLKAAYRFYCDKDLENAHSAEDDVRATYDVLRSQLERYQDTEWEDRSGNKSVPVVNDVEALHRFTNLSRPVDFAGRMVFNEAGEEICSCGKHKGRTVEAVFAIEPSYYSWMMQGDFPLYTKQCLDTVWQRFRAKQKEQRAQSPSKPEGTAKTPHTASQPVHDNRHAGKPQRYGRPRRKPGPITDDMLKNLQAKFGK